MFVSKSLSVIELTFKAQTKVIVVEFEHANMEVYQNIQAQLVGLKIGVLGVSEGSFIAGKKITFRFYV